MSNVTFDFRDLARLKRMLNKDELAGAAFRQEFERLGDFALERFRQEAPRGLTGQLRSTMYQRVQQRAVPLWVAVRAPAKSRRYRYAGRTAFDRRLRSAGWYDRAVAATRGGFEAFLHRVGAAMARNWSRM